jgi:hypothetical protein
MQVLLKALIETNEVQIPSCFIITNRKIGVDSDDQSSLGTEEETSQAIDNAHKWVEKLADFGSCILLFQTLPVVFASVVSR